MHVKNKWGDTKNSVWSVTGLEQEFENALMFGRGGH